MRTLEKQDNRWLARLTRFSHLINRYAFWLILAVILIITLTATGVLDPFWQWVERMLL